MAHGGLSSIVEHLRVCIGVFGVGLEADLLFKV